MERDIKKLLKAQQISQKQSYMDFSDPQVSN